MFPILLTAALAASIILGVFLYRNFNRKRPIPAVLRSAAIVKINSYKSFGIMATVQFNDAGAPQVGERIQQEGDTYKIKGVVFESPQQHNHVWECKLEKIWYSMHYVRIYWLNRDEDEAEIQYSELDDLRFECRKIELYPDGSFGIANSNFNFGGTALSVEPVPRPQELNHNSHMVAEDLSPEEFETVWYKYYNYLSAWFLQRFYKTCPMHPFMIKTPSGRFYVKPAGTPDHEKYSVDIDGEEITMEKDDDGYLRAPGATSNGHRFHMGLLNMIADYIANETDWNLQSPVWNSTESVAN